MFLFSLDQIKYNLNKLFISKLRNLITSSVNTRFKSFLFGFISSSLIQSSSGVTAISISLLSSNYINKKECLGIIIGANLGTCITSFIIALNIENISLIIITISIILFFILFRYRKVIKLFIYIGLMLLGLDILSNGFDIIINNNMYIYTFIQSSQDSNILSLLFGILTTAIIQSSSGIIGIVQGMYNSHLVSLSSSVCIMLGANIGTTFTGFLATINTNNKTRDVIYANLIFNIIGVLLFYILLNPYINHLFNIQNKYFINNIKFTIAYAHFIFNLITVILGYICFDIFILFINRKKRDC